MRTGKAAVAGASILSAAVVVAALWASGWRSRTNSSASGGGAVVARVNGVELGERELRWQIERLSPHYQVHGAKLTQSIEPTIRQKALDRLILEELVLLEAQRRKLVVSNEDVEARITRLRAPYPGEAQFETAVQQKYGSLDELRRHLQAVLLIEQLWQQEVIQPSQVTQTEIRDFYQKNPSRFMRPESVRVQAISFPASARSSQVDKKLVRSRADKVLTRARAAKTFAEFGALAERFSQGPESVTNGDYGWLHRGSVDPELRVIFGLKPGEVTGVVESRSGFHILRVDARQPEAKLTLGEVQNQIRGLLQRQKQQERARGLEQRLRRDARIEMP